MPFIRIKGDEPLERALRRFKRKLDREGLFKELKKHEHYEKPSQQRRRKLLRAKQKERRILNESLS
ncbi:30S ribosomal protein S21 [candidate division NPL-UPA2 bacterium Unc8]|uniref:Small ribosomal subunit protein bS21 n=1 Tax=candidate division NPL-UPA2 bacterium Unc8 TaxID=1980939 RepID=A0A399FXJ9_UNCN2|nr:30S ribosomal protein S21 [Bacillota bacterium]RII01125.1 MAG: 30S ribosomal protein S21 [candidate division NPL-UPA2 bacterium Unc8]